MEKFLNVLFVVILEIALVILLSFLMAYPVMVLWNMLSTKLFVTDLKRIDVMSAWQLNILCSILFGKTITSKSKSKNN